MDIDHIDTSHPDTAQMDVDVCSTNEICYPKAWYDVLLPYCSDDAIVTKLWMTSKAMQSLLMGNLTSLVIKVRRTGPTALEPKKPGSGGDNCYCRPPFLPLLTSLIRLSIVVPQPLRFWMEHRLRTHPTSLPPNLRYIETSDRTLINVYSFSEFRPPPSDHLLGWLSRRSDVTLGPMLSQQIMDSTQITNYIWDLAIKAINSHSPLRGEDANLIRHLTHLNDRARIQLAALEPALWDSPAFKILAKAITSCTVHITTLARANWLSEHFPNLTQLEGWSVLLPPQLHTFTHCIFSNTVTPNLVPSFPSGLTKIVLNSTFGPWPTHWPEALTHLCVNVKPVDLNGEVFYGHISSLPRGLQHLSYNTTFKGGVNSINSSEWWDVATMLALPATLKSLTVPDLPKGWSEDEMAVLAHLPSQLTKIHASQHYTQVGAEPQLLTWIAAIPHAAWLILPVGLVNATISTREVIHSLPGGGLFWSSEASSISMLLARFVNLTALSIAVVTPGDLWDVLPSKLTSLAINHYNNHSQPGYHTLSFEGVQWPSRLQTLHVYGNSYCDHLSADSLDALPDSVEFLCIGIEDIDHPMITLPKKWPKALLHVLIECHEDHVHHIINTVMRPHTDFFPDINIVCFMVNHHRMTSDRLRRIEDRRYYNTRGTNN